MLDSVLICANFGFLMYVCGKTFITGCNSQKVHEDDTYIDEFENVIANINDCKSVEEINSIVYCVQCRRILGYVDEYRNAHLQNVRILEFSPIGMNNDEDKIVSFMKMRECSGLKRKHCNDRFDLMDEPIPKKTRLDTMFVMRVGPTNRNDQPLEPHHIDNFLLAEDDSFFIEMDNTLTENAVEDSEPPALIAYTPPLDESFGPVITPGIYIDPLSPYHSPALLVNSSPIDYSSAFTPGIYINSLTPYRSPMRYSTPVSNVHTLSSDSNISIAQHFDSISLSSDISFAEPYFRPVYNTPVNDYYDSVGGYSPYSVPPSPIVVDEETIADPIQPIAFVPAMGFNIYEYGTYMGQQNEGLNFYNHYVNQPNSTQEIQEIDMESTGENDEPDLNALVRYLIATARRNGLEVISRFIRMLEAAIEAM